MKSPQKGDIPTFKYASGQFCNGLTEFKKFHTFSLCYKPFRILILFLLLVSQKKIQEPQYYLLVSPGECLGLPGFFKSSFFAFVFFIMRRIKSRFNVLWDFLSAVSVKVWKETLLLFSCVIFSYVTFILSWWRNEAIAFVAWALPWQSATTCLFGIIFTLYFSPLILRCSRNTKSHNIAWCSAVMLILLLFSWYPGRLLIGWTALWPHPSPTEPAFHWPQ